MPDWRAAPAGDTGAASAPCHLPARLSMHEMPVHAVNILITHKKNPTFKRHKKPRKPGAYVLTISGHFHFCLTSNLSRYSRGRCIPPSIWGTLFNDSAADGRTFPYTATPGDNRS